MSDHHALVYTLKDRGEIERTIEALRALHALTVLERAVWGIADSRALVGEVYKLENDGRTRAFALICGDITIEAQNALLKVVEEPPAHSRLVFFLAPEVSLLSTLRSRVQMAGGDAAQNSLTPAFVEWRAQPLSGQIATIEAKLKKKDEAWMEAVVRGAQVVLHNEHRLYPKKVAQQLYYALERVGTRGASNKMLLEEIALLFSSVAKKR